MNIEQIGKTISLLRKRAGYTQKELADRIGISDKAVSKWERGQGLPEISYLRKLSILLDVDTDSLLAGNIAHHNNGWHGVIVLDSNSYGISAGTFIYDKPLINYLFSYFLLVGIKKIHVVCGSGDREYIQKEFDSGSDYGIQILCHQSIKNIIPENNINYMILYGRCILYGVDQTRFFLKAMVEKNRLTIMALPKKSEPLHISIDMKILESNKPETLRTQYDYSRIPFLFIPADMMEMLSKSESVPVFLDQHEVFVEMLDRGFVEIEAEDWDNIQDASTFMRIVQSKCGMNVYCLEEVAWRRGFISLEQLKSLGEKHARTEYGLYILDLYERMREK